MVVEYHQLPSLIGLNRLEHHLSELLGVKVDIGIKGDLKPHIKDSVLSELVTV